MCCHLTYVLVAPLSSLFMPLTLAFRPL
jgi:hypothetical protein